MRDVFVRFKKFNVNAFLSDRLGIVNWTGRSGSVWRQGVSWWLGRLFMSFFRDIRKYFTDLVCRCRQRRSRGLTAS